MGSTTQQPAGRKRRDPGRKKRDPGRKSRDPGRIAFPLSIGLIAVFLCLKLVSPKTYLGIAREDHIVEYLQAGFYLLAAVIAIVTACRLLKTAVSITALLYLCFGLALLLIFFEEISWGQRLLGVESTGFFREHNDQQEITLHNLKSVQRFNCIAYILVGFYGAFAWLIVPGRITRGNSLSHLILPPPRLILYFLPTALFCTYWELGRTVFAKSFTWREYTFGFWLGFRNQEPVELMLALGMFFFVMINYRRLPRPTTSSAEEEK